MKLDASTNDQLMAMAAHRYCLGRFSYIVAPCLDWLRATWPQFAPNTRNVMVRDTIEALMDNAAGGQGDTRDWKAFATWAYRALDAEGKDWVRHAVAWREKPWPLEEE